MSDINRVTLIGNVGGEPEYKYFESGSYITNFSIAVNRYDKKEQKDITDWFKVKTFSKLGEYIKSGIRVSVDGRLQTDTWEKDGEKRKLVYIFAENLQILSKKDE